MKSHDIARALTHLSRVLRAGPNVDILEVGNLDVHASPKQKRKRSEEIEERGAALALLSNLAEYKKAELVELIRSLDLDVEVKPTDSVRDLLGRTLKFLSEHPEQRERLARPRSSPSTSVSPTLARALTILMGD